jgi:formate dehydrogenase maturation protein FdhE
MQVLCFSNDESVEVRCSNCGQGFALYWGLQTETEKAVALDGMVQSLKVHNCINSGAKARSGQGSLALA